MFNIKKVKYASYLATGGPSPERHRGHDPAHPRTDAAGEIIEPAEDIEETATTPTATAVATLPGVWNYRQIYGGLAETWGMEQGHRLTREEYEHIMATEHPTAGTWLLRRQKEDRVAFYDSVLSAPPGLGLEIYGGDHGKEVKEAFDAAVARTVKMIGERYIYANVGGDKEPVKAEAWGHIAYDESVASPVKDEQGNVVADPELHKHLIIPNVCMVGGQNFPLAGEYLLNGDTIKLIGVFFRQTLREELAARDVPTCHRIIEGAHGYFELANVSPDQLDKFSNRRKKILEEKERNGGENFLAWLKDRSHDYDDMPTDNPDRIRQRIEDSGGLEGDHSAAWTRENEKWAATLGTTGAQLRRGVDAEHHADQLDVWRSAIERVMERNSSAPREKFEREYIAEVMRRGLVLGDIQQAWTEARYTGLIIESKHADRYTAPEAVLEQMKIRALANEPAAPLLPKESHEKLLEIPAKSGRLAYSNLDAEQQGIIHASGTATTRAIFVNAPAGAGKTTLIDTLQRVADARGVQVIGLAPTGPAAARMRQAGLEAQTIYSYLRHIGDKPRRKPALLIVDEAGMVDRVSMLRVLESAKTHGDRVLFLGDTCQLQAVAAGQDFREIVNEDAGTVLHLTRTYRQRNARLKEIVTLARESPAEGIALLAKDGRAFQSEDEAERLKHVRDWYDVRNVNGQLVLAFTHRETRRLNRILRDKMTAAGQIDRTKSALVLTQPDQDNPETVTLDLAPGDIVAATSNLYRLGVREADTIWNGDRLRVDSITQDWLHVTRLDDNTQTHISTGQAIPLTRGFALTIHRAQGAQASRMLMYVDTSKSAARKELTYTALSRAQDEAYLVTDSLTTLCNQSEKSEAEYSNLPHPKSRDELAAIIAARANFKAQKLERLPAWKDSLFDDLNAAAEKWRAKEDERKAAAREKAKERISPDEIIKQEMDAMARLLADDLQEFERARGGRAR